MTPVSLPVDELLSYAVRADGSVRVHLHLAEDDIDPGHATVLLRAGRRTLDAPAEVARGRTGTTVEFTVTTDPARRAWRMLLQPAGETDALTLQARLLVAEDQPVALLVGPVPETVMAPPAPRPPSTAARKVARRLPEPVKGPLRRAAQSLRPRPTP